MVDRRLVDEDDISKIGLRIKAARVLTSLNQEEFAEKFGFGHASVKNWELGRSIPRKETFVKIISSLGESGVQVTMDWVLYGSGFGPVHSFLDTVPSNSLSGIEREMAEFEKWCKQHKQNPLITIVSDNMMAPFYLEGDYIGGIELNFDEYKKQSSSSSKETDTPFLVEIEADNYQPRFLRYDKSGELKWFQSIRNNSIDELEFNGLGKIMLVRRML